MFCVVKQSFLSYRFYANAEGGNRTRTPFRAQNLSPVRLPVPPPRRSELLRARVGSHGSCVKVRLNVLAISYQSILSENWMILGSLA